MIFTSRLGLANKHALLSPSTYHWINYDPQKLEAKYHSSRAAQRGTRLHDLAKNAIELGVRMPDIAKTINLYVNDGIDYRMSCEVALYYSDDCFGHADAISFYDSVLRIHDLKNGIAKTSFMQLIIYAALFCLEYGVDPFAIRTILRIYQHDDVQEFEPSPEEIDDVMSKIVDSVNYIAQLREEDLR
jgi:hypothetical protein